MRRNSLQIKLFADGADLNAISKMAANPLIQGFTTNPSLMRKAKVRDYRDFALEVVKVVPDRPVSFEVFSDEFDEMEAQALEIASWGKNIYVKIPVTNTRGEFAGSVIQRLSGAGIKINVTAIMTAQQVRRVLESLNSEVPSYISVFAGRVADTGRDPVPMMARVVALLKTHALAELIWASPRELLNVFQADAIGCHIITLTNDILSKFQMVGKNLDDYSLETVKMFYEDAASAGYQIEISESRLDLARSAK
jgi:transaldolase